MRVALARRVGLGPAILLRPQQPEAASWLLAIADLLGFRKLKRYRKMADDQLAIAAELERLADHMRRLADQVHQRENGGSSVIARILRGELLTLDQGADVAECSDEKLRKHCELTAGTSRPLGIKFANRWFVGKLELLDDLEQGKIDRRRGPQVRQRAEERAGKYEGWARPQKLPAMRKRATSDGSEAPSDAA
jgi:hypothetical protein